MDKELISALSNINVNSDTALQIADQYITYMYVENICVLILVALVFNFVMKVINKIDK